MLGERVKEGRRRRGWSLKQLAANTGLSQPYLSNVERGLATPSDNALERLEHVLEMPAGALFQLAYRLAPDVREILINDPEMCECLRVLQRAGLNGTDLRRILEREAARLEEGA